MMTRGGEARRKKEKEEKAVGQSSLRYSETQDYRRLLVATMPDEEAPFGDSKASLLHLVEPFKRLLYLLASVSLQWLSVSRRTSRCNYLAALLSHSGTHFLGCIASL